MHIESGPTTERRIRNTLLCIMVTGFSIWFAYDGLVGYPIKNREEFLSQLKLEERDKARQGLVYPNLKFREAHGRDEWVEQARQAIFTAGASGSEKAVRDLIGGPPSYENREAWYYFGPAYSLKFTLSAGTPIEVMGVRGQKKESDINTQIGLAAILGALALYSIFFTIRVTTTRLVLDDAGLSIRGGRPISWDAMKSLDIESFGRKGCVWLVHDDAGIERRLKLDEYHYAKFDDIVDAICDRKKFENPLPVQESAPAPQT